MKTIKVIRRRYLFNPDTGATASLYGACPAGYVVREGGYTWEVTKANGSVTVGLGRVPAKTEEEALEIANQVAARTGAEVV